VVSPPGASVTKIPLRKICLPPWTEIAVMGSSPGEAPEGEKRSMTSPPTSVGAVTSAPRTTAPAAVVNCNVVTGGCVSPQYLSVVPSKA
jgi:hypothetical protein